MDNFEVDGDLDRFLSEINEKLNSNKFNIFFEKSEIKRAERLLCELRHNLEDQSKDLIMLMQESNRLEEDIKKCSDNKYLKELHNDQSRIISTMDKESLERINLKRKNTENIDDETTIIDKEFRKSSTGQLSAETMFSRNIDLEDHDNVSELQSGVSSNSCGEVTEDTSVLPILKITIKPMKLKTVDDVTISAISSKYNFGIFFGGTKGFLMKYFNNKEHIYKTNVNDNIKQIEIMFRDKNPILVAFSHKNVFIYENINDENFVKKLFLSETKSIFNEGNSFYITMRSGIIKTINKSNWGVCDYAVIDYFKDGVFHPCTISNKYFLVSLKDKLLYKTQNENLSDLKLIDGIENVIRVFKMKRFGYICFSDETIWFLNNDCELTGSLPFKSRVKFIQLTYSHAVIVDGMYFVHVYPLLKNNTFGKKIFEKHMDKGLISAMDVTSDTIIIAYRSSVLTISPYCIISKEKERLEEVTDYRGYRLSRKSLEIEIKHPETFHYERETDNYTIEIVTEGFTADSKTEINSDRDCNVVDENTSKSCGSMTGFIKSLKNMELKTLKGVTVTSITQRNIPGILFGGSNGFLMKYYNNEEHIYETKVKDDIIQIEIMFIAKRAILIAFTKNDVVVFENITNQTASKNLNLPGMSAIFNEGTLFYVTFNNGNIKSINGSHWRVLDYRQNDYNKNGMFLPCSVMSKYHLVYMKDKLLYRTKNKNLSDLEVIKGIVDVDKCLKVNGIGYLCYSVNTIYFLNQNFELCGNVPFVSGIKCLHCTFNHGVVVDRRNVVHVYLVLRKSNFGEKIFEKTMEGPVTAVFVNEDNVYIAVEDIVYTLNLK